MAKQTEVSINNVNVPMIEEGEVRYYPISYIGSKVLLKNLTGNQLTQNGYGEYVKQFEVSYGLGTGGIQNSYCISEDGLKIILSNSKIGRLSLEQKRAMNGLLIYLGERLICEDERFSYDVPIGVVKKYTEYIQDCIKEVLEVDAGIVWQKCSKCNCYYPYHINFFKDNPHHGKEFELYTICRDCNGWTEQRGKDWIRINNIELSNLHRKYGDIVYGYYANHDVLQVYNHWITLDKKQLPSVINNKEDKLMIIKHLYAKGEFDQYDDITHDVIHKVTKLSPYENGFISEIRMALLGSNYKTDVVNDIDTAKVIFFNYLEKHKIKYDGDKKYDLLYADILKDCKLRGYLKRRGNDQLGLVMDLYDNQYPAYKFKGGSINYWKDRNCRINALRYLIEEDMKIPIEKIPLYLTLESLRKHSGTMRNLLKTYYGSNLWLWVNELYVDRFDEMDFNITVIRNVFDSAEENIVNDVLVGKFKNVLYNQRNTKNSIAILGMQPDWFIFTDNGVWVVEYFGIAVDQREYNQRVTDYKKKALSKIEKYKTLDWLRTVYVYPDDLKDNFKGLEEKLSVVV